MTSAQKGEGIKEYLKLVDKQYRIWRTEGILGQKIKKNCERHIWKPPHPFRRIRPSAKLSKARDLARPPAAHQILALQIQVRSQSDLPLNSEEN